MTPNSMETILAQAATGDWDFFDQLPDDIRDGVKKRVSLEQARDEEEGKVIASAWARFARSADGRKAIEAMFNVTLRRTVFFVSLGQDAQSMAMWGAFREGQNALAQEIARQIARGQSEKLKPRDV